MTASAAFLARLWRDRTSETTAGVADTYAYPATSNRLATVTRRAASAPSARRAQTIRTIGYSANGSILTDNRAGSAYVFTYNNANRLKTVTLGSLLGTYTYNGQEQLVTRTITNSGTANGTILLARLWRDPLDPRSHG